MYREGRLPARDLQSHLQHHASLKMKFSRVSALAAPSTARKIKVPDILHLVTVSQSSFSSRGPGLQTTFPGSRFCLGLGSSFTGSGVCFWTGLTGVLGFRPIQYCNIITITTVKKTAVAVGHCVVDSQSDTLLSNC